MNETIKLLNQLRDENFYGRVELQFHDGQIVLIRKEETIKPQGTTLCQSKKTSAAV